MDTTETTHISLCSGYGGIDLGLKRVIPNLRTVAYAEIEAFACENLLARMEGGQLDAAPIWSDLKSFPWHQFSGLVDILSGGYPCQPFSAAGKRAGADDPRHLWPFISSGIQILRPRLCFFENVEGHISLGLREVIADLESLGYQATWGIFSAAEVGAPHQRKRVFILAVSSGFRGAAGVSGSLTRNERQSGVVDNCGAQDVWPSRPGEPQHAWEPPRVVGNAEGCMSRIKAERQWRESAGGGSEEVVGNAESIRSAALRAKHERLSRELRTASSSGKEVVGDAQSERRRGLDDESSETSGWQARGHADGTSTSEQQEQRQTQQSLVRNIDGTPSGLDYAELCKSCDNRTDELRLLGNGVVPATAALAFRTLLKELTQ